MKINDSPSMNDILHRRVRFYLTNPSPCPYLDGAVERKVFTNLAVEDAEDLHYVLSNHGFRRSQSIIYRPACEHCRACMPTRVPVEKFSQTKRWRRVWKKSANLVRTAQPPRATREQYRLLKTYLDSRHFDGGMAEMSQSDYVSMIEGSPLPSVIFEYRAGEEDDAPLIAAAIADVLRDGLSMVYSFFDPAYNDRGLGNYIILDHIEHARELRLPYVYLGYWVKGSRKMGYKADFRPLEVLDADKWRDIQELDE